MPGASDLVLADLVVFGAFNLRNTVDVREPACPGVQSRSAHMARCSQVHTTLPGIRESLNNPNLCGFEGRGRGGLDLKLDDIADRPGTALVTGYGASGR